MVLAEGTHTQIFQNAMPKPQNIEVVYPIIDRERDLALTSIPDQFMQGGISINIYALDADNPQDLFYDNEDMTMEMFSFILK